MIALVSLLALAPVQRGFVFDVEMDVHGTVNSIASPLAAPLDGVAAGDPVLLHLEFLASDAPCTTASGFLGYDITSVRCTLDVGQVQVGIDPMTASCFLGEESVPMVGFVRTELAADLEGGLGSAELQLLDPTGATDLSVFSIVDESLIVADITSPSFSSIFELRDPSGGLGVTIDLERIDGLLLLNSVCPVVPNSTGVGTRLYRRGGYDLASNDLTLGAVRLPPSSFALFLTSQTQGFFQQPGNSAGNLCLGGSIGRFFGPGQVQPTGTGGPIELPIDLTALPQPMGTATVLPGETWFFSVWFRDVTGTTTSNFGATVALTFS